MKSLTPFAAIAIVFAAFIAMLLAVGAPSSRPPEKARPAHHDVATPPAAVSSDGLTLASLDVTLPDDTAAYPDGPHADVINANCTACHSAAMALYQPPLSAAKWQDEVEKMRDTFKANVAEKDVPAIVEYLTAMSAKTAAANGDPVPAS